MEIPKLPPQCCGSDIQSNFDPTGAYQPQVMPQQQLYNSAAGQTALTSFAWGECGCRGDIPQRTADLALAVIQGIQHLMNSVTRIFSRLSAPPPTPIPPAPGPTPSPDPGPTPSPGPEPTPSPGPGQTPPADSTPTSLIPSWAKIFEYTGNSEWRPGGASQKAYLDLRRELKGKIQSIEILSPDGTTVIARGRLEKVGSDGRPRFRFDTNGFNLPEGAIIKATLVPNAQGGHGGIRYIEIPRPGKKFTF